MIFCHLCQGSHYQGSHHWGSHHYEYEGKSFRRGGSVVFHQGDLPSGVPPSGLSPLGLPPSGLLIIDKIMFHPSSELFTGCLSKHVLSISCQHPVTPSSLIWPVFICPTFSMWACLLSVETALLLGHHSFSYAAPSVWNSLPSEIRHIQSTTAFKTALKTCLFKSYLC